MKADHGLAPEALRPHILRIEHVAVAVRSIDAALRTFGGSLALAHSGTEDVAGDHVRVAFLTVGESHLELVQPIDPAAETGITKFLAKRGEGIHHIAFAVKDIDRAVEALVAAGLPLIDPRPRPGSRGTKVAFLHPTGTHGVLVELVETPPR